MIRVFVSDIDGCLSEPYRPFNLDLMGVLAGHGASGDRRGVPAAPPDLSICTGRAYGYLEAVSQALGIRVPALFESGAGMFDPVRAATRWHPDFTAELARELADLREWLGSRISGTAMSVDHGKRSQASLVGPVEEEIAALVPVVREHVARSHPSLMVAATWISIDVLDPRLSKRSGLAWLADELDVTLGEMAFIGDTEGDLGGLSVVGRSFAPANADPAVRAAVQTVTTGHNIDGVLEAYLMCADENRR